MLSTAFEARPALVNASVIAVTRGVTLPSISPKYAVVVW
jgi:hypothetical protein